jgi:RNA-directed DNA polymerase
LGASVGGLPGILNLSADVAFEWVLLYIERWLRAPVRLEDGSVAVKGEVAGDCGGVRAHGTCKSAEEAQALWSALADRFAACKLVLHPEKTRIVYCKDANRRGDFPNQSFDFLGFSFRARKTIWQGILPAHGFMPAASPKALTAISRTIRRWTLHQRSDKSLQDLANMYNPYIGGWINYYGQFYRAQLRSTLQRIDGYLVRWARRKYKRLRERPKGTRDWLARVHRANPTLFAHWRFVNVGGRTSEAV